MKVKRTIWKYEIRVDKPLIEMPAGAEILTVQMQDDVATVWALVDPKAPKQPRELHVYGTGWEIPARVEHYIGTWQNDGLVWHLFEVK